MRYFHFKCKVCGQEFDLPYYEDIRDTPEEMFAVMEHEDNHADEGVTMAWDCEIIEKED
jgi:hypothetical protein